MQNKASSCFLFSIIMVIVFHFLSNVFNYWHLSNTKLVAMTMVATTMVAMTTVAMATVALTIVAMTTLIYCSYFTHNCSHTCIL